MLDVTNLSMADIAEAGGLVSVSETPESKSLAQIKLDYERDVYQDDVMTYGGEDEDDS